MTTETESAAAIFLITETALAMVDGDPRHAMSYLVMAQAKLLARMTPKGDQTGACEAALTGSDFTIRRVLHTNGVKIGPSPYVRPDTMPFDPQLDPPEARA